MAAKSPRNPLQIRFPWCGFRYLGKMNVECTRLDEIHKNPLNLEIGNKFIYRARRGVDDQCTSLFPREITKPSHHIM
ncbi:hypothetical protein SADUNF_Sadunf06G0209900 [Salix dunnii]|uniref:Uncharacterized protein n=1 Tax=Salix dunnii TaxID=1413687 RepID=A0A835K8F4_9ROSI|nr:hypothetical protein SADUNF_Sadunf06G0209900 [Salix dunnii]